MLSIAAARKVPRWGETFLFLFLGGCSRVAPASGAIRRRSRNAALFPADDSKGGSTFSKGNAIDDRSPRIISPVTLELCSVRLKIGVVVLDKNTRRGRERRSRAKTSRGRERDDWSRAGISIVEVVGTRAGRSGSTRSRTAFSSRSEKHGQFEAAVIGTGVRLAPRDRCRAPPLRYICPRGSLRTFPVTQVHEPGNSTELVRLASEENRSPSSGKTTASERESFLLDSQMFRSSELSTLSIGDAVSREPVFAFAISCRIFRDVRSIVARPRTNGETARKVRARVSRVSSKLESIERSRQSALSNAERPWKNGREEAFEKSVPGK